MLKCTRKNSALQVNPIQTAIGNFIKFLNLAHKCDWTVHSIIVSDYIMKRVFNSSVVYGALVKQKSRKTVIHDMDLN